MTTPGTDAATRVAQLSAVLRAHAVNGLHYAKSPYDTDRFERILDIAAELLSLVDDRVPEDIRAAYRGDLTYRTPLVGADAVVFDGSGRLLLVKRSDNERWCMPGGAADVGESPSEAAVRECWEETGLRVKPTGLIGLLDNRLTYDHPAHHLYYVEVACEVVGGELTTTHETVDFGWFTEEETAGLEFHRGHDAKVRLAFQAHRGEIETPVLH